MAGEQMVLRAIDHVGIAVPDLDAALTWYRETLGMTVEYVETNTEQGVTEAMVRVSDDDTGARLQILAPSSPDSPIARFLDRSGPGMQQLAYRVDDVEHASKVLRERGLRLLYDEPRRGTAESMINFVHPSDAGGVLIELVEPAGEQPSVSPTEPRRIP
ncbi:MAG TPA: methylmalonyl-CoA epimerase [Jiangellaceae bacterium]|nr:methylmalonyl-CoA epimerase [Jiangellaceae bacterium]